MGISKKLALYIFVVSVLFLIVALIFNYSQARKIGLIKESYSSRDSAVDIAQFVSKLLREKAQKALSIAQAPVISEELIKRNEFWEGLDGQARVKKIDSLDKLWIETKDENDPFIQGYLDNPIADYFHRLEGAKKGEYGEIFLTDKYGALVASTSKLTTLAHVHKYWWQGSYNEGSGRVFFDDRGYDDSVGDYVLGIVVPVHKNEEIIGILKCNFMVLEGISTIIEDFKDKGVTIGLARSGGLIIYEPDSQPLQARVPEKLIEKFLKPNSGSVVLERKSGDMLTGYAPVPLTLGNNNQGFGGSPQSIDHRQGNRGESWHIYLSKDLEAVYALAHERTKPIMITGLALIVIMAVVSIILGYCLTKPINKLALVAKKIGHGDLNVSEVPDSKDEIGKLGKSIKSMADSLKNTLISKDKLVNEVESHRQTAKDLRESKTILQAAMDKSQAGIAIADAPAGRFRYVNDSGLLILGRTREVVVNGIGTDEYVSHWKIFDLDGTPLPSDQVPLARAILYGETNNREFIIRRSEHEDRIVWANATPIRNEQGEVTAGIMFFHDFTERKEMEEALREQLDFSESLIETAQAIILVLDPQGRIVRFNPYMEDLVGYDLDEVKGMDWFETFIKPENGNTVKSVFQKAVDDIQTRGKVNPIIAKDGRTILVEWYNKTLKNKDGGTEGILAIGHDITERKQAEKEQERLQAQLNQAQKMESVGRLAGGVAHDFNNKLSIINGYAELSLDMLDTEEPVYENLREIYSAGKRSANIVRQLLAFARQQTISPLRVDLNYAISDMLKMLQRLIGENIDIAWLPGKNLWQIKMDPSQLDQIMANLVVNARDAIADVGRLTIETKNIVVDEDHCRQYSYFVPGRYVMLAVSDNGCGMEKQVQDNLFEPFFTTKGVDKGTGLGLSTTYGIVKQNKGFINVYSEPGQGTTFKIYLPPDEETISSLHTAKVSTEQIPTGTESVLVVEDEKTILQMSKQMLERLGYAVQASGNPFDALEISDEYDGRINLLITDVVMPEMNGRDLSAQLSKNHPGLKTLYMSGYTADVIAHHGVLEKGVHFIQKPFSIQDLAVKVREAIEQD